MSYSPSIQAIKKSIRADIRHRRSSLSKHQRLVASEAIIKQLKQTPEFKRAQSIALFCATNEEPNLLPLTAKKSRKNQALNKLFLAPIVPQLRAKRALRFGRYDSKRLKKNRFLIDEPNLKAQPPTSLIAIDIVLVPLVAFDIDGNRIGMGGGFYDSTFHSIPYQLRPKFIGIAFDCQFVSTLPQNNWDLSLHSVITEKKVYKFT